MSTLQTPTTIMEDNWRLHQELFGWLISVDSLTEAADRLGISERFFKKARLFGADHIGALGIAATDFVLPHVSAIKGPVLDIASGLSGPGRAIASHLGLEVIGLDLIHEHCVAAQKLALLLDSGDASVICGTAEELPFPDDSFETAFCIGSFSHLPDRLKVLKEARRVLKHGGKLVVLDEHGVVPAKGVSLSGFFADPVYTFVTRAELDEIVGQAGFRVYTYEEITRRAMTMVKERLLLLRSAWSLAVEIMGPELCRRIAAILEELRGHYQEGTIIPVLLIMEKTE
jgi:SAM-dependent methyltransferase